ncbi:MAG: hypothetical protein HC819_22565 [Cyclobacteriaceae bacterium]|nr:hypothetical protein [Cyclobacteriaceae bacterium]
MKKLIILSFALALTFPALATVGTLENIEVNSSYVGVKFEDDDQTLVLSFSDQIHEPMHSVIQISKISDLKYKTRVMRYFGGLVVCQSYKFKNLVLEIDGQRMSYDFTRANVSTVVNKMCQ